MSYKAFHIYSKQFQVEAQYFAHLDTPYSFFNKQDNTMIQLHHDKHKLQNRSLQKLALSSITDFDL